MSSLPNFSFRNFAREAMLDGSATSSWWKTIKSERPKSSCNFLTASIPFFSSLEVKITMTPLVANCLHISNPMPLFEPVTTAYLVRNQIRKNLNYSIYFARFSKLHNHEKRKKVLSRKKICTMTPLKSYLFKYYSHKNRRNRWYDITFLLLEMLMMLLPLLQPWNMWFRKQIWI